LLRAVVGDQSCAVVHHHAGPQWNTSVVVYRCARVTGGFVTVLLAPEYVDVVVEGIALAMVQAHGYRTGFTVLTLHWYACG